MGRHGTGFEERRPTWATSSPGWWRERLLTCKEPQALVVLSIQKSAEVALKVLRDGAK